MEIQKVIRATRILLEIKFSRYHYLELEVG